MRHVEHSRQRDDTQVTNNTQVEGKRCVNNPDSGKVEMGGLSELVGQTARVAAVLEEGEEEDIVIDDDLLKFASKRKLET